MRQEFNNALYLYLIRGIQLLFPLMTIPYVARILNQEGFANVILFQSSSVFIGLFIEFGFNYTATREISQSDKLSGHKIIFGRITSSKILLSLAAFLVLLIYLVFEGNRIATLIVISAIFQGFSPVWYFQGISNLKPVAFMEIASKTFSIMLMFLLVKQPDSSSIYITIITLSSVVASLLLNINILRSVGIVLPKFKEVIWTLKDGLPLFIFRMGSALYTGSSLVLLASVVPAAGFAIYAGADRIFRSATALTGPIGDAFYPRIAALSVTDKIAARRAKKTGSIAILTVSIVLCVVIYFFSPTIVRLLLGDKYKESVEILKILAFDIPLIAIGTILGVFEIMVKKIDKYLTISVVCAGLWVVTSIYLIVPTFGIKFMAYSILIAEAIVIAVSYVGLFLYEKKERNV